MADMQEQNNTPRRADTGSYPGRSADVSKSAGSYRPAEEHTGEETRLIKGIKRRNTSGKRKVLNAEKERFDFKELFSKKHMRRFRNHLIFYLVLVTIALVGSYYVITAANDINAFVKEDQIIVVSIEKGSGAEKIGKVLQEAGVIDLDLAWQGYCKFKKITNFQYGEYELNSNMCYKEIIRELQKSSVSRKTAKITIPEGYTQEEIVDLLVEHEYADRAKLEKIIAEYDFDYPFLKDLPKRNNRLEGYLFPDTYEIFVKDEVSIIDTMLKNFEKKVYTDELKPLIESSEYTIDEIVTMASIVEREGADNSEFKNVASVFYNRLNDEDYPYLESCATVQYVLPQRKDVLSIADTKMDNPYNTYKNPGLPAGPIACPGIDAIKAAIDPAETDYYFFVASSEGTLFSKTYNEHLANVRKAGNGKGGTSTVN